MRTRPSAGGAALPARRLASMTATTALPARAPRAPSPGHEVGEGHGARQVAGGQNSDRVAPPGQAVLGHGPRVITRPRVGTGYNLPHGRAQTRALPSHEDLAGVVGARARPGRTA